MKRVFEEAKGILLIMKITNRQFAHANAMMCTCAAAVVR